MNFVEGRFTWKNCVVIPSSILLLFCCLLPLILSSSKDSFSGIERLERVLEEKDRQQEQESISSNLELISSNHHDYSSTTPHPDNSPFGFGEIIHEEDTEEDEGESDYDTDERVIMDRVPFIVPTYRNIMHNKEPWSGCHDPVPSDSGVDLIHCVLSGESLTEVPKNFSKGVTKITLESTGIAELRPSSFKPYNESLKDIYVLTATKLTYIHPAAFRNLRHLQTLSIHQAPLLTHIPNGVFNRRALRVLRITRTSLESLPRMVFQSQDIFDIIDIDNNRIKNLTRNGVTVRANIMSLEGNEIEFVDEAAFNGSHISKLILKDNRRLGVIHDRAFSGLHHLRTLDLSFTSITKLPTDGLEDLEILKLQGIHSLKVIPSVYDFKEIREVHMTYSYHCCAFRLPHEVNDNERIYREFSEETKKLCNNEGDSLKNDDHPLTSSSATSLSFSGNFVHTEQYPIHNRKQRSINENKQQDDVSGEQHSRKVHYKRRTIRETTTSSLEPSIKQVKWNQVRLVRSLNNGNVDRVILQGDKETSSLSDHESSLSFSSGSKDRALHVTNKKKDVVHGSKEAGKESRRQYRNEEEEQERKSRQKSKPQEYVNDNLIMGPVVNSTDDETLFDEKQHREGDTLNKRDRDHALLRTEEQESQNEHVDQVIVNLRGMSPFSVSRGNDDSSSPSLSFQERLKMPIASSHSKKFDSFRKRNHHHDNHDRDEVSLRIKNMKVDFSERFHEIDELEKHFDEELEEDEEYPFQEDDPLLGINEFPDKNPQHHFYSNSSYHPSSTSSPDKEAKLIFCGKIDFSKRDVICSPEPDAFNPCEDVMGNILLRISVWFVVIFAVVGNLCVIIVLMSSKFKMTVSKFLMCNLAFADFCMGVYLFMIAVVDFHTIGVYFNYADTWQHGLGCRIAGFVTIFASCLSIFTLTIITLERLYAITYAIHLNRRLRLGLAAKVMGFGWIYSIVMASLPLIGVSGYDKTSICLPMETESIFDRLYLFSLLTINAVAFVVICCCYAKMYHAIISQETRATVNDTTIAKRMALLVFTDFACWAPIAFFGLTAVSGYPLINVTNSKILLVFFYPLNSCSNPYLYAILTKQYRRDFFILTSRLGFCRSRAEKYKPGSTQQQWQQNQLEHQRRQRQQNNNLQIASYSFRPNNPLVSSQGICSAVASDPNFCRNCDGHCQRSSRVSSLSHNNHRFRKNKSHLMTDSCHDASCDSSHSCRCIVYSAVDPLESGSMDRIDSNHEIVRVGHIHNNLSCNGNIMRDRETSVDNENSIANGICCCSKRPRSTTRSLINAIKKSFSSSDDREGEGSSSLQRRSSLPGCQAGNGGKTCKCRLHRISKSVGNNNVRKRNNKSPPKVNNHIHMPSSSSSSKIQGNCLGREINISRDECDDEDSKAKNVTTSTRMSSAASTTGSILGLGLNKRKCLSSNNVRSSCDHKSHKSCTSFVQRESSSSGDKSSCVSNPVSFSEDLSTLRSTHRNHSGHHGHCHHHHHRSHQHHDWCKGSNSRNRQSRGMTSCGSSSCVRRTGMRASSSSCLEQNNKADSKKSNNSNSINFCRCILSTTSESLGERGSSHDENCPHYQDHRSKSSSNCISKSNSQSLHQESQL